MSARLLFFLAMLPLAAQAQQDWRTPAEVSDYRTTPDYDATMTYLRRVQAAAPGEVRIEPFGKTGEGRELDLVIASRDGVFDPQILHQAHRPILLVENAIHAGEMDGKDASMALLRDMVITKTQAALLDRAVFVFIPVYNADGFARLGRFNRINQNGPELTGWRGNGTNLNLNRDYLKAQAPETQAFWPMYERWLPDFFVDDHVTDGADFRYDVTYSIDHGPDVDPGLAGYLGNTVTPELQSAVDKAPGHLASPTYIQLADENDPSKGLGYFADPPRYSCGSILLENRPCMLVEMHMLKSYRTRVTGNTILLEALLMILNRDADKLLAMNAQADAHAAQVAGKPLGLAYAPNGDTSPFLLHGYDYTLSQSTISGAQMVTYSHTPRDFMLQAQTGVVAVSTATPPAAYIIPAQWTSIINVLRTHGVPMEQLTQAWTGSVEQYQCSNNVWQRPPFEGRHPLFAGEAAPPEAGHFGGCTLSQQTATYPAGSVVVRLDNRLSKMAVHWLEPAAPDSALAWGFFDPIFEQREYGEPYVVEKLAREMLTNNPLLKAEFDSKVQADAKFAASPAARLAFFYDHSPYYTANRVGVYPVGRLQTLQGLPIQ